MDEKEFTGRFSLTVELDCYEADAELLEENLKRLVSERVDSFLSVTDCNFVVEKYKE